MSDYSSIDKMLHAIALGPGWVREMSFDMDCALARTDAGEITRRPHVFVTGLARAGTTLLLRALDEAGTFAAQSYRDMPFVLAPNLWRRISGSSRKNVSLVERAHGDGLEVSPDSLDAFEEVFWMTFAGEAYVKPDRLLAHRCAPDTLEAFRRFVANVIAAHGGNGVYLSKNNNNVLRLPDIATAFPKSAIVIPFRDPFEHAFSLMRQHQQFSALQEHDAFARKYMSWIGHFEFGLDHRPFDFGGLSSALHHRPHEPDYWVSYWTYVYEGVLSSAPEGAVFWDFDRFTEDARGAFARLQARISVLEHTPDEILASVSPPPKRADKTGIDKSVAEKALALHGKLKARASD